MATDSNRLKSVDEVTSLFRGLFTYPIYFIKKGEDNLEIRASEHIYDSDSMREEPFSDRDGTILGRTNWRVNFFVFNRDPKTQIPPQWALDSIREWCSERWGIIPSDPGFFEREEQRAWEKTERRLWEYYPDQYVQWLLKSYPDVSIWDEDGEKVEIEVYDPRDRIG